MRTDSRRRGVAAAAAAVITLIRSYEEYTDCRNLRLHRSITATEAGDLLCDAAQNARYEKLSAQACRHFSQDIPPDCVMFQL